MAPGAMGDAGFDSGSLEGMYALRKCSRRTNKMQACDHLQTFIGRRAPCKTIIEKFVRCLIQLTPLTTQDLRQSSQQLPIGNQQQHPNNHNPGQQGSSFGNQMVDFSGSPSQPQQPKQLSEMTESEKWGLEGLRAQLPNRPDADPFIMGHDLDSLGIDFNRCVVRTRCDERLTSRNEPLFPTFAGPFADANARPAIPDFTIPPAYRVNNVPDLASRMPNFTDETLLMIFYQYPRDMLQEQSAAELFSRDWRWHKELQQWMMKDTSVAAPIRISERVERGVYIFFDAANFRKERVSL